MVGATPRCDNHWFAFRHGRHCPVGVHRIAEVKVSRLARQFDLPAGEETIVIVAIFFFPVVLLTILLRAVGLRGHPWVNI
jgi:hypothetical protein